MTVPCLSVKFLAHNGSQREKEINKKISRPLEQRRLAREMFPMWKISHVEMRCEPCHQFEPWLMEHSERAGVKAAQTAADDSQPHGSHPIKWKWGIHSPGCSSGEDCGCGHEIATGEGFSNYSNNSEWEGLPSSSEMPRVLWPQSHFQGSYLQSFISSLTSAHI